MDCLFFSQEIYGKHLHLVSQGLFRVDDSRTYAPVLPEYATMNYDEMGHVVPARRRLDEDDYVVGSNQVGGQPNMMYVEPTPVDAHA